MERGHERSEMALEIRTCTMLLCLHAPRSVQRYISPLRELGLGGILEVNFLRKCFLRQTQLVPLQARRPQRLSLSSFQLVPSRR